MKQSEGSLEKLIEVHEPKIALNSRRFLIFPRVNRGIRWTVLEQEQKSYFMGSVAYLFLFLMVRDKIGTLKTRSRV